jgi:hypothetical protein
MYRIIFLLLITSASFGQVLQETNGSRADNRNVFKLGFRLPQVCWVTSNPNLLNYSAFMSKGAMVYDTCAGKIKRWSGSAWISVADSMATGDTTGLGALYIRNTTTHEDKRFSVQSGRLDSILAASSAGLSMYSNSGTQVGLFGAGGGAGATFYGGVNIDGTTRLNTGLTGVLVGTSGTVSATPNKMVSTFAKNATRDSAILTLADGTRLAVRDSVGSGGTPGGGTYSIQYNRAGAFAGRSTFVFDTVNARVGIGTASPAAVLSVTSASGGINSGLKITNNGAGTVDYAAAEFVNNVGDLSQVFLSGSGYTPINTVRARGGGWSNSGTGGLSFVAGSDGPNSVITFATGSALVERMRVNANGAVITSTATDPLLINGSNSVRSSFQVSNSVNTGNASFYLQNNRGSFAAYGGQLMGGSVDAGGDVFGVQRRDRFFVFADGASMLGMAIGTITNQPLIIGTNNAERIRVEGDGDVGIGTTAPAASSILNIVSTTKGFLRPVQTTAQRNAIASPAAGLSVYNSSLATNDVYTTAWYQQPNGLSGSGTLDFPSTGAHSSSDLTITVTGAAVGDIVMLGTPVQDIDATFTAFVSAANTVTVRFNHYGSGTTNPASGTFKVYVIKN